MNQITYDLYTLGPFPKRTQIVSTAEAHEYTDKNMYHPKTGGRGGNGGTPELFFSGGQLLPVPTSLPPLKIPYVSLSLLPVFALYPIVHTRLDRFYTSLTLDQTLSQNRKFGMLLVETKPFFPRMPPR